MSTNKNSGKWTKSLRSRKTPDLKVIPTKKRVKSEKSNQVVANKNSKTDGNQDVLQQKIFSNELILDCIFGFLNYDDIKRFRLVCVQWNKVLIPFLKKRSAISFKMPKYSLQNFNQLFENSQMGTNFASIKLTDGIKRNDEWSWSRKYINWTLGEFTEVLESRKNTMKELTIKEIDLGRGHLRYNDCFDIGHYIAPSLTKICISEMRPNLSISTDQLTSAKFLHLEDCQLNIVNDVKIKPVELTLKNVTIKQNGTTKNSLLNEFFNFDRLKCLSVGDNYLVSNGGDRRNLALHFMDSITVKTLNLCGKAHNLKFKDGKWKVTEKLSLSHSDFSAQRGIEFDDLEFKGALLDLSVLPINLRRLKLSNTNTEITKVICSNPVSFPELEFLHLNIKVTHNFCDNRPAGLKMPWISHFKNCENLTTVMLTFKNSNAIDHFCKLYVGRLPEKVENLYVNGKIVFFGNDDKIALKKLYVQGGNPVSLTSILQRFRGLELTVDLRNFDAVPSLVYQTVIDISKGPFQSIAVALNHPKQKPKSRYLGSPLSKCTDKFSEFYAFADEFGNAISKSQFEELSALK